MIEYSAKTLDLKRRLEGFMQQHVYPNESVYWTQMRDAAPTGHAAVSDSIKEKARAEGLWNLFLPECDHGAGLTNFEYAPLCEIMGRSLMAPELFNCSAPDTGNMEVLARYGTDEQKARWLEPLLDGRIRSAFAMTEPDVASSDAINISSVIVRDGDEYVVNGHKHYATGLSDDRCEIIIFMGKSAPDHADRHRRQSMVLIPRKTPGVTVVRSQTIFGYDGSIDRTTEARFENVRIPLSNMLLGEGRGFEIAQGRLGPGRIHHCMRLIGLAERMLEKMCKRAASRSTFGRRIADRTTTLERIAEARVLIDQARFLTLNAAHRMDTVGNKGAKAEIAMIKVVAPNMACKVIDWAIQAFGAVGTSDDFMLAPAYALARALRIADGPDEVHRNQIAKLELAKHAGSGP